ncbi:hypothetical protein JCM1393_23300 [Clostridium carnis]
MHQDRFKWAGIGYNFFVEKDGEIVEGRGYNVGAHAKGNNIDSIGIAMAGNFDESVPADEQWESLIELCIYLMFKYDIEPNRVIGHRELKGVTKSCPGERFNMNFLRDSLRETLNNL